MFASNYFEHLRKKLFFKSSLVLASFWIKNGNGTFIAVCLYYIPSQKHGYNL